MTPSRRQTVRRSLILVSALLFPVTYVYLSPAVVFQGARLGVVSGSYIVFALLFVAALAFGRAWCGWACPAAGLCEVVEVVDRRPFRATWAKAIKYALWAPWLVAIALVAALVGGGFSSVDPLLGTEAGISAHDIPMLAVYYAVVALIVVPTLALGRRGFCHTLCWMAPFMVIGRKLSNAARLPALRLAARADDCEDCGRCAKACPMSLPVPAMVRAGRLDHADCLLCASCADDCAHNVLSLRFQRPRR